MIPKSGNRFSIRSCCKTERCKWASRTTSLFIERVPTLRTLGRDALRILAIGAESRYVHKGEVLFIAGEPADCGYVIQEGSFQLDSALEAGRRRSSPVPARCSASWR